MGKKILIISAALAVSALLVLYIPSPKAKNPQDVYRVYLKGSSLGLIENKEELEQYIDNLFFYMNRIYSTLFKIKFAYYNELDSELKYLDSILSINNEDIREILLKNIGSDICD